MELHSVSVTTNDSDELDNYANNYVDDGDGDSNDGDSDDGGSDNGDSDDSEAMDREQVPISSIARNF